MPDQFAPVGTEVFWRKQPNEPLTARAIHGGVEMVAPPLPVCGADGCKAPGMQLVGRWNHDDDGNPYDPPLPVYQCTDGHYTVIELVEPDGGTEG